MQIFVKLLVGRTIMLDVEPFETTFCIKRRLSELHDVDFDRCTLLICGKVMFNHQTMSDCNIRLESTIHAVYQKIIFITPPIKDIMITMNFVGILPIIWANMTSESTKYITSEKN